MSVAGDLSNPLEGILMSNVGRHVAGGTLAVVGGIGILCAHSLLFPQTPPEQEEYYFTKLLAQNYSWYTAGGFFLWGGIITLLTRSSPFLVGPAMALVFPAAMVYEMSIDSTSHNLFPFELVVYAVFAIPSTLGAFLGWLLMKFIDKRCTGRA